MPFCPECKGEYRGGFDICKDTISRYNETGCRVKHPIFLLDRVTVLCYVIIEVMKMDEELISKKELLAHFGISYGALYRWKRKNLIPEEWFIRKSTYTGQETFFPKEKMLERIKRIQELKEDASLDVIAENFSDRFREINVTEMQIREKNYFKSIALDLYIERFGSQTKYDFQKLLHIHIVDGLLIEGMVSKDEAKETLALLAENHIKYTGRSCGVALFRKHGVFAGLMAGDLSDITFDEACVKIFECSLSIRIESLKTLLNNKG